GAAAREARRRRRRRHGHLDRRRTSLRGRYRPVQQAHRSRARRQPYASHAALGEKQDGRAAGARPSAQPRNLVLTILGVVLLVVHAVALVVLLALDLALLDGTDVSVGCGIRLGTRDVRLTAFEMPGFLVGQRAVVDAVGDALLLIRIALHVGLQALR